MADDGLAKLKAVLDGFDSCTDPIDEHEISSALRPLVSGTEVVPTELLAEVMAFGFQEEHHWEGAGWGTYFGPMAVWRNDDGTATESPSIKRVTPEMITYWERRSCEASHPVLRARYADLCWDFSKVVTGETADFRTAQAAIDAIVELARDARHKYPTSVIAKLRRALSLACSLNDSARARRVRDAIIAYEDSVAEDDKPGLWGFSLDLLSGCKKAHLTEAQGKRLIASLEDRLQRLSVSTDNRPVDPWGSEAAALLLAKEYRQQGRPDDVARVLRAFGKAFEEHCRTGSPLQVSAWLQRVHAVYVEFGLREDANRISVRLRQEGDRVAEDMKQISHSMRISDDELRKYIEASTRGSMEKTLARLATDHLVKRKQVEAQVRDLAGHAPLMFLIHRQIQDRHGRPVASVGGLDDDLEGNVVTQMAQNMSIAAFFIRMLLQEVVKKFDVSADKLLEYLFQSPAFHTEKRGLVKAGLAAFLRGDHVVAVHILIPQIEDALRNIVELTGGTVLRTRRGGGFQLRTLDDLLRDERIEDVFGADAAFYFRVLLTDERGWNLRNTVCHGLASEADFCAAAADRVLHLLLCLSLVRDAKPEVGDSRPQPDGRIGILGYGSIVSNPGWEIEQATEEKLDTVTPFLVEYARSSGGRGGAPTVVKVAEGKGSPVEATVFVLKKTVGMRRAHDILYRRELNCVGDKRKTYDDGAQREKLRNGRDAVVVDTYAGAGLGVDSVLYTTLSANIQEELDGLKSEDRKAACLAQKAVKSVTAKMYVEGRDGIRYLDDNIDSKIETPLTKAYRREVLSAVQGAGDLTSARRLLAARRSCSPVVAGIDGCRAGWLAVWGDGGTNWTFRVFKDMKSLCRTLEHADLIVVDIPIGLPSGSPRACDLEARKLLGQPRGSSVFPPPCREALSAKTHAEASAINRKVLGKGITVQCWGICPKIREVDELLRSDENARSVVREGHPEVSFLAFAGRPMAHRKSRCNGVEERLEVLRGRWPAVDDLFEQATGRFLRRDVGRDDILDAAAMYLTACSRPLATIPDRPERDDVELPMDMTLPTRGN
jgi:predicted RNase H-like nuclease